MMGSDAECQWMSSPFNSFSCRLALLLLFISFTSSISNCLSMSSSQSSNIANFSRAAWQAWSFLLFREFFLLGLTMRTETLLLNKSMAPCAWRLLFRLRHRTATKRRSVAKATADNMLVSSTTSSEFSFFFLFFRKISGADKLSTIFDMIK